MIRGPILGATAAAATCAALAIAAGRGSWLGWTALYAEPVAVVLGFVVTRAVQDRRRTPTP